MSRGLFSKSFAPPVGFPPYSGFKSRKCHPWLVDNEGEVRQARQQWSNGEDREQCRRPRRSVPTSPASCMQASPAFCACRRPPLPVRADVPCFLCVQTSPTSCACRRPPLPVCRRPRFLCVRRRPRLLPVRAPFNINEKTGVPHFSFLFLLFF